MSKIHIEPIIAAAQRAPTGDNSQPFLFEWSEPVLKIYHDNVTARHYLNFNFVASEISLGAVLELTEIAASQQGFQIEWKLIELDKSLDLCLVAEGRFTADAKTSKDPLYDYIGQRKCIRSEYDGKELSKEIVALILAEGAKKTNAVKINFARRLSDETVKRCIVQERIIWSRSEPVRDTFKWIRWTYKTYAKLGDGLYWKELGIKFFEYFLVQSFTKWPHLPGLFIKYGLSEVFDGVIRRNIKSSSGFILISSNRPNNQTLPDVGRAAIRAWLAASQFQLAAQPLTTSSVFIFADELKKLPTNITEDELKNIRNTRKLLQSDFGLEAQDLPVWLLRIGKPLKDQPMTLRKSTQQVMKLISDKK